VRRVAAWILAASVAAPALLAVGLPGLDIDALRCAMSCGHAVRSGAICCPAGAGGGAWKTCRPDGAALLCFAVPVPAALPPSFRLTRPEGSALLAAEPPLGPGSTFDAPPDHVPLALS